jgi:nucleotidyltransferase substrate binding protein (TIGR01987 family)
MAGHLGRIMSPIAQDIARRLSALPFVDAVWLFGSAARGTDGAASDLDLAIAAPRASAAEWRIVEAVIEDAPTLRRVDCIRWDELAADDPLRASIRRDRVLVHERETGLSERDADFPEAHGRLAEALARLAAGLALPEALAHPLMRDGLIQRFEFCAEQLWKTLRFALRARGLDPAGSPRALLEAAAAERWLDDEAAWLDLLRDRNRTSHAYRKAIADEVLGKLAAHLARMQALADALPAYLGGAPRNPVATR